MDFATCSHATFGDIPCPTPTADSLIGTHLGMSDYLQPDADPLLLVNRPGFRGGCLV